jgi:hypothetical protein
VKKALLAAIILLLPLCSAQTWNILYREQFYKLYHEHLHHYSDDTMEDMYYLEQALKADFANPLYALAKISDPVDWERYRYLFTMHVNLKLVYLSLTLGARYDKMNAYFFNAPWKQQNLDSLEIARRIYQSATGYWEEAKKWSSKAWDLRGVHLPEIQEWEDENARIEGGTLDYARIIGDQLAHVDKVLSEFQRMNQSTY